MSAAVAAIAVAAWFIADDENEHLPSGDVRQAATSSQWGQLVNRGREEARAAVLARWPFAAIKVGPRMPEPLRKRAWQTLGGPEQFALRFNDARFARTSGRVGVWLVPGNHVICMFRAANMAGACSTSARVYRQGLVLQTYKQRDGRPRSYTSLGVVPDHFKTVPAKLGNRWIQVPVIDNTFYVESKKSIGIPFSLKRQQKR